MLHLIRLLPDEITMHIYYFISIDTLLWLSKTNYDKYHSNVLHTTIKQKDKNIYNYIRYIVRTDNYVALNDILSNAQFFGISTGNNYKIKYKYKKYSSIFDYLMYLCVENDKPSTKCKNIILNMYKNTHKNKL
jgi:hypothetical protein